jgi:RNA polymerase primary sigma factor
MLLIDTHTPRARKLEAAAASSSRRMTVEEETRLAKRSLKGGRTGADARNKLVMANYGLIHMVAGAYRRAGVRYEDLVQEGAMGLMRAAETFDPTRGVRFGTYAVYWIRSKVQRFIEAQRRESNPLMAGVDAVDHADGKRHIPRGSTLSLEAPLDAAADRTVADTVSDPEALSPEEQTVGEMTRQRLEAALWNACQKLRDPRAEVILKRRLLSDEPETLSEVGKRLHLSREGARILELRVLKAARTALKKGQADGEMEMLKAG